jgi:ssDNA-binding Zn-finger/Zn-ribbon topoisomerase 1
MAIEEKPSRNEDEYFTRQDAELMKARRAELDAARRQQERKTHFMKCPKCGADLKEVQFQNLRVDVCPECKGTWLDAGELEMIRYVQTSAVTRFIDDMLKSFRAK